MTVCRSCSAARRRTTPRAEKRCWCARSAGWVAWVLSRRGRPGQPGQDECPWGGRGGGQPWKAGCTLGALVLEHPFWQGFDSCSPHVRGCVSVHQMLAKDEDCSSISHLAAAACRCPNRSVPNTTRTRFSCACAAHLGFSRERTDQMPATVRAALLLLPCLACCGSDCRRGLGRTSTPARLWKGGSEMPPAWNWEWSRGRELEGGRERTEGALLPSLWAEAAERRAPPLVQEQLWGCSALALFSNPWQVAAVVPSHL